MQVWILETSNRVLFSARARHVMKVILMGGVLRRRWWRIKSTSLTEHNSTNYALPPSRISYVGLLFHDVGRQYIRCSSNTIPGFD